MTDFKFSCPACGQRMLAGPNYQGRSIGCPACHATITVPTLAEGQLLPAEPPKPIPTPSERASLKSPPKTSALAKASLGLSIASLGIGPLGFVPGIICGHLARREMRNDPRVAGKGLATAGLWISYGFVVMGLGVLAVVLATGSLIGGRMQQQTASVPPAAASASASDRTGRQPAPAAAMDSTSEDANDGWKADLTDVTIPGDPVSGRMRGQKFVCNRVEVSPAATPRFLILQQGEGAQGDFKITIIIPDRDGLEGRKINLPKASEIPAEGDYRVAILWQDNGEYHSQQFTRSINGFALRLESEPRSHKRVKGRIYLCLGDEQKSFVAGTFDAKVQ
jgi:hypothetical protein